MSKDTYLSEYFEERKHNESNFLYALYPHDDKISNPSSDILPHYHDAVEINIVNAGTPTFYIDGQEYKTAKGDIIFTNPNEIHLRFLDDSNANFDGIVFNQNIINYSNMNFEEKSVFEGFLNGTLGFKTNLSQINQEIVYLIKKVQKLLHDESPSNFILQGLFMQIFGILIKEKAIINRDVSIRTTNPLRRSIDYMQQNFSNKITLDILAKKSRFCRQYYCECFKKHMYCTPMEYLNMIRVRHAMNRIINSDTPILEIAYEAGFSNFSYFTKTFKNTTGFTPSAYRKKNRK